MVDYSNKVLMSVVLICSQFRNLKLSFPTVHRLMLIVSETISTKQALRGELPRQLVIFEDWLDDGHINKH